MKKLKGRLPVREGVETVTYHRQPTASETRSGFGAIHYADFPLDECCHSGTRIPKKWLISDRDGLRYHR